MASERDLQVAVERLVGYLGGKWDLTRDLELSGEDPLTQELDLHFRRFRKALHKALLDQDATLAQSAATAARNSTRTHDMQGRVTEMKSGMAGSVSALAQVSAGAQDAATAVSHSAQLVDQAHQASNATAAQAAEMSAAITEITAVMGRVSAQLTELGQQSRQVSDLSQVVRGIARQVNMLSLNASIEAARAGVHGRGFQVVATEVRRLAEHTARQAHQIDAVVARVAEQLGQASNAMVSGLTRVGQLTGQVQAAASAAADIDKLIMQVTGPFQQLYASMEEHSAAMSEVSAAVTQISGHTERMSEHASLVAGESGSLLDLVQRAQTQLGLFYKGSYTDEIHASTKAMARELTEFLERAIAAGRVTLDDLLALEYTEIRGAAIREITRICRVDGVPVTGFNPPKYATRYDRKLDLELREILDRYHGAHPGLLYTSILDLNGYAPISNAYSCRDWTGDFKHDANYSRFKRLTTDAAQLDASRMGLKVPTRKEISVGPYVRDPRTVYSRAELQRMGNRLRQADDPADLFMLHTFAGLSGKVASFCAVPLYIQGQRYGAAFIGWEPKST